MKQMKLAVDDSNKGFVCSSSNSSTISDSEICQLNESVYELHKPEGEPSIQILFFHGFQYRNYDDVHLSTWKSRDGPHFWPQTWLVQEFPGAHVFCVLYDARVDKGQGNFELPIIGENLTCDVVRANIGQLLHCTVILVGHCFGGLVIKQLCLHAHKIVSSKGKSSETGLKLRRFLQNVKGIFYYATPHQGISPNIAPWFGPEGPLLPFVKTFSKYSARLKSEFDDLRHGHYRNAWRVAGVGESLPTKGGPFKDVVVVPEASARDGVESFNLVEEADHFSITKPESKIKRSFYALKDLIASVALDLKVNVPVHECEDLPDYPVDLERPALDIREKLKDHQVLGIVGMGGIGKTTLAKTVFNYISREFEYTCFLDNAKRIPIHELEDRLLGQFHHNGSKVNRSKIEWPNLRGTKTLIVIDDVDSQDQLSVLPKLHRFGSSSRVIITTRNQILLTKVFEDYVFHHVEFLKEADARTLFCKHAFRQGEIPSSLTGREQLVKDVEAVVRKCGGLPLTLEVIGRHLRGHENHANLWTETIGRLGNAQPIDGDREDRVWAKLQVSYDALRREEQEMFISAATFFFDWPLERALAAWSTTCGTPETGWANLVSRSLVKEVCKPIAYIYSNFPQSEATIWVHEHLRDLGKILAPGNTMSASNKEDPQKLSGLLNANSVDAKTEFLELLYSPYGWSKEQRTFQFESLLNLEQLKYVELQNVLLRGSPEKFPRKISLLSWDGPDGQFEDFPVSCIQEMENLAILELQNWRTSQAFPEALGRLTNLRILKLESMPALNHLPEDFGRLSHVKRLKLKGLSLSKLPESFGNLSSLEYIHFDELELTELPESFGNLSSLVTVQFLRCKKLVSLPANFGLLPSLETLVIDCGFSIGSMMNCLPDSFGQLKTLRWLSMGAEELQSLPSNFCSLSSLQVLIINADHLETLPENLGQLTSLQELFVCVCDMKALPESVGRLSSLRKLTFWADVVETLPDSLGQLDSLQELKIVCCNIKSLPESLGMLSSLRDLIIQCRELEFLPEYFASLQSLALFACKKLKSLPDSLGRLSSRQQTIDGPKYTSSSSNGMDLYIHECPLLHESMVSSLGWVRVGGHDTLFHYTRGSAYPN